MRSRVAEDLKREQRTRFAAMTAEARVALARKLADRWLADFMSAHQVGRRIARSVLRRSRRAGRKPSSSMDGRDDS